MTARADHSRIAGSGGGHDHGAVLAANERTLKISMWLTGIYFSTIQVETECDEDDSAAAIDFANIDPVQPNSARAEG
jgi:hypothetical protein